MKRTLLGILALGAATGCALYLIAAKQKKTNAAERAAFLRELEACKRDLSANPQKFEGLYNATGMGEAGQLNEEALEALHFSWAARLEDDPGFTNLAARFHKVFDASGNLQAAFREWLQFLKVLGLERVVENELVLTKDTLRKYDTTDNCEEQLGQLVKIVRPYWVINGRIAEKGEVRV